MSVIINGFDLSDNEPYWWGWTMTRDGARGHVDPDSREDFFAELLTAGLATGELTMTVNGRTWARGGTSPHKGGRWLYDTATGQAIQANGSGTWTYGGDNTAMTLSICCYTTGSVPVDPTLMDCGWVSAGTGLGAVTIPAMSNGMLVVFAAWWYDSTAPKTPFSATLGGTALTRLDSSAAEYSPGGNMAIEVHYLLNPPSGSPNLQVVDSIGGGTWKGWFLLENVNQASPFGAVATNLGTGSDSSLTLSGADLPLNAAFGVHQSGGVMATPTGGGQTECWSEKAGHIAFGGGHDASAPTWDWGASVGWVATGVRVRGG